MINFQRQLLADHTQNMVYCHNLFQQSRVAVPPLLVNMAPYPTLQTPMALVIQSRELLGQSPYQHISPVLDQTICFDGVSEVIPITTLQTSFVLVIIVVVSPISTTSANQVTRAPHMVYIPLVQSLHLQKHLLLGVPRPYLPQWPLQTPTNPFCSSGQFIST